MSPQGKNVSSWGVIEGQGHSKVATFLKHIFSSVVHIKMVFFTPQNTILTLYRVDECENVPL